MLPQHLSFYVLAFFKCSFALFSLTSGASSNSEGWEHVYANNSQSVVPLFKFGEKNYYMADHVQLTYLQAEQFCNDIHMELISIKSKEENDFISQYISKTHPDETFWSSGSRMLDKKNWIWMANGEPVDYTNWQPGKPGGTTDLCLNLHQIKNKGLLWSDYGCNNKLYFLCERDNGKNYREKNTKDSQWSGLFQDSTLSPNVPLLHFNGTGYYFGNIFKATFLEANQFCQMIDMKLLSIESSEENSRIYKYIRDTRAGDDYWTSGTRQINGQTWTWLSTGQTVEYTNWASGQPDFESEKCIELWNRDTGLMWNNLACTDQLYFICERPLADRPAPTTGQCCCKSTKNNPAINSTTVTHLDGKRYLISTTKVNYYDATELCNSYEMQLLTIKDKTKTEVVKKLLKNKLYGSTELYWVAGNQLSDAKTWTWANGDPITYFNWAAGEPNNARHNEYCVDVYMNAQWNDQPCEDNMYFICEDVDKVDLLC